MIKFGAWSTLLGLSALFGCTMAVFLARSRLNRLGNRLLGALLVVLALKLAPYILGFAGFYDACPWLSFAPFDLTLAVGPLLWLHLCQLTTGRLPHRAWRHFVPVAVQAAYSSCVFVLPLAVKNRWNDSIHQRWIDPAETLVQALSLAVYIALAWRRQRAYQAWLDGHLSNREEFRLAWVRNLVLALFVMLCVWAPYEVVALVERLDYYQRFPLYVGLALLVCYLGVEGWRHADTRYPVPGPPACRPAGEPAAATPRAGDPPGENAPEAVPRDWAPQGRRWLQQLAETGLWRDADLSLERLARALGTNTSYLSRAFNEGLAMSFNEAVNGLRVQDVQQRLEDATEARDLLALALEAGFSSKTSFNRVFKAKTGQTPSAYRKARLEAGAKR